MNSISSCPHYVYELVDPRDNSVFYVGITINLYERYKQHIQCDGINPQKDARIQEILLAGHLPIMRTREQVEVFDQALVRETYWIAFYLQQGIKLTNIAGVVKGVISNPRKPEVTLISTMELKSYRLGKTELNARWCSFDEFVSFAQSLVQIADTGNLRTVFQRRDFLNWCLQEGILRVEDDRLQINVMTDNLEGA